MRPSKKLASVLADGKFIKKEERDVYAYGFEIFASTALEIISIIVIAAFVGNFTATLVFFAAFIPIRIYAGGYHADTKLRCYLISLAVYAMFTAVLKFIPQNMFGTIGIVMAAADIILVFWLAPVVHINKSVNSKEYGIYKKASRIIVLAEVIIWGVIFGVLKSKFYATAFILGQGAVVISMIAALIKEVKRD